MFQIRMWAKGEREDGIFSERLEISESIEE
jgi:hypothetical protein